MKKFSKEQKQDLIAKLTVFLRGLTQKEIDEVVTEAKKQVKFKDLQQEKKNLVNPFNSQMNH